MKLNKAILAIFAFSLLMTALNTAGIFNAKMPVNANISISDARITDLTQSTNEVTGISDVDASLGLFDFLLTSIKTLQDIIFSIRNINYVLIAYGIPEELIPLFYGMLILITVMGLMKLILGRSDKGIE